VIAGCDDGPFFDDLEVGEYLPSLPAVSLTESDNVLYRMITGDQYSLSSDLSLARRVTRTRGPGIVNPTLLINYSIGQSTMATRRAIANLYYRNLTVLRPVEVGITLRTLTQVIALSTSKPKPGAGQRGKVLLDIRTFSDEELVMAYQRCALLPCRSESAGRHNNPIPTQTVTAIDGFAESAPVGWDLGPLGGPVQWPVGERRTDVTRDHVDLAAAFARLTFNQAAVHRDSDASMYGKRLVYGGHVVALAQASLNRLLPQLATVLGWAECSHTAPVFENDVLRFEHHLIDQRTALTGSVSQFDTCATRTVDGVEETVLRWSPIVLHS